MCKSINFNNLRKKKRFAGKDVVVEWSFTFVETQKTTKKTQKEWKENTKNNLLFEQWKNNKTSFYYFQKK